MDHAWKERDEKEPTARQNEKESKYTKKEINRREEKRRNTKRERERGGERECKNYSINGTKGRKKKKERNRR